MPRKLRGRDLRKAREDAGFTQEELGRLLNVVRPTIREIEKENLTVDGPFAGRWMIACTPEAEALAVAEASG